ncbi:putative F0F1-ATPase subunit [Planomonospora sphaerica]|uniref:Putative F0F1-ATPase subunit n=2 Tax=Planomonospora sphaerica TaxID=161355 RepID=A0A171BQ15_9ACTN|nr:putative F0F1-ATPase subunit [Planomonospora sphaerica]
MPAMSEQERRPQDDGRDFADAAWSIPSYILSGIILYGGGGWLLSRWTGVAVLTPIGVIIGVVLAIYLVYRKYGR